MKKKKLSLLYIAALGLIFFAAGCGSSSNNTIVAYVMFGNPSSPSTGNPGVDSIATTTTTTIPTPPSADAMMEKDKKTKTSPEKDTVKIKAETKIQAESVVKNSVSCIGEGACSKPTSLASNAPERAIAVTFSYSTQTPNTISLIFKLADITTNQPGQVAGMADGSQYTFGAPLTLDDPMYAPLGMQGTMMIPAAAGTVKNDGTTVTITMPLVPATPGQ